MRCSVVFELEWVPWKETNHKKARIRTMEHHDPVKLFATVHLKDGRKEKGCVRCSLLLCEESRWGCYPDVLG
jgi:hypothetical protein